MLRPLRVVGAIGAITRLYSVAFLLPVLIALAYDPYDLRLWGFRMPRNVVVFFFAFAGTYLLGTALRITAASVQDDDLQDREAYLTVGLGWLLICALSMVPFMLSGTLTHPVEAFFESMSGLTTTGATVIGDLEAVAPSVMMWRAFLQFLGGMGIIVLSVAVLARLTQGGLQMLQAEAPGPSVTRIAPRLAQTARILWMVYLALAGMLFVILCIVIGRHGMPWGEVGYEALLHTFTTISTGGFSNHSASIAYFGDPLLEAVIILFMLIAGTNFTLHHLWMHGQWRPLLKDPEWRFFLSMFLAVTAVITVVLWAGGHHPLGALRGAAFTVGSLITSTGFGTADFDGWPDVTRLLILLIMVTGGTAGSTAGGLKHVRVLLLLKVLGREVTRIRHPHAVVPIRLAGRVIKPETVMATAGFFFAFVAMWIVGTVLLIAIDPAFTSIVDAASASISAISNMGPGLGVVGPSKNYAGLQLGSKMVLSLLMWFGRLEIFTALVVLTPRTWRQ